MISKELMVFNEVRVICTNSIALGTSHFVDANSIALSEHTLLAKIYFSPA